MAKWKLCFVLLLLLIVCYDCEETVVKTIGREPDVTPICTNTTSNPIALVVCRIRTIMNGEKECCLFYELTEGFKHGCDSRFTLVIKNQTVFLHLINLTPVDSGDYTCECTRHGGMDTVHLNITVEEYEDSSNSTKVPTLYFLTGATIIVLITAVIFVVIYRGIRQGSQPEPLRSHHDTQEPEDIEPYSTFVQREGGLYSTVRLHVCDTDTNTSNMATKQDTHAGNLL